MKPAKNTLSRRQSLKYLAAGSLGAGLLLTHCEPTAEPAPETHQHHHGDPAHPLPERDQKLMAAQFFDEHEMRTIHVLGDLIIPADETSGSASDAGTPAFIEFMAKDQPKLQTPLRGGLRWLDLYSLRRYGKAFIDCLPDEQTALLDAIAYPATAAPELAQGVAFFNLMRNLVATGFFSSKIGVEYLQYQGNIGTVWTGPPAEWIARLGVGDLA
ncbi:MAG: gluconate 2-dehydrogenase subunit 3 family protein [Bacteroidia bacterium]